MTSSSDKDIGILIGEMKSLTAMVAANHASSEISRRRLHEEQNELRIALVTIDHKVETGNKETINIKERLENAEKVTGEMKAWRERLVGMKMLVIAQWVVVGFFVSGMLTLGWKWVQAKLGL